ncbi:MAG: hypothetical protein ABJH05_10915 [Fulvivirga sp.]
MAKPSIELIEALRNTVKQLQYSDQYQWGHMGSCNCGFLAQEISKLSKDQIHSRAMQKYGDWNDQLNDYCPTSGMLMDDLITQMLDFGLDTDDLRNLEKLSDTKVLRRLPTNNRYLSQNKKSDVIKYIKAWVDLLEEQLTATVHVPQPKSIQVTEFAK